MKVQVKDLVGGLFPQHNNQTSFHSNHTIHHFHEEEPDEFDLTEYIVTTVGKSLALVYCIGLVLVILYYCYTVPQDEASVSVEERRRGRRGRAWRYKDLPPSYDTIHFAELPPHYEDVSFGALLCSPG